MSYRLLAAVVLLASCSKPKSPVATVPPKPFNVDDLPTFEVPKDTKASEWQTLDNAAPPSHEAQAKPKRKHLKQSAPPDGTCVDSPTSVNCTLTLNDSSPIGFQTGEFQSGFAVQLPSVDLKEGACYKIGLAHNNIADMTEIECPQ
jgi:hypothetical protein